MKSQASVLPVISLSTLFFVSAAMADKSGDAILDQYADIAQAVYEDSLTSARDMQAKN